MINLYAYTYPSARTKIPGYILTKVGDTHRAVQTRLNEQGGAAEYEYKHLIGQWNDLNNIKRDYDIHYILEKKGLKHTEGNGTEWFKIPGENDKDVFEYIDKIVSDLENRTVRKAVTLRVLQEKKMKETVDIIEEAAKNGKNVATVIANLCPRFGKTIWALSLFNEISKRWKNRTMLLPVYWLSSQTSFKNEISQFSDFLDIEILNGNDPLAADKYWNFISDPKKRVVILFSLHGNFDSWVKKYGWISGIPLDDIFSFIDEGDFGTHTSEQHKKLSFIFDRH